MWVRAGGRECWGELSRVELRVELHSAFVVCLFVSLFMFLVPMWIFNVEDSYRGVRMKELSLDAENKLMGTQKQLYFYPHWTSSAVSLVHMYVCLHISALLDVLHCSCIESAVDS